MFGFLSAQGNLSCNCHFWTKVQGLFHLGTPLCTPQQVGEDSGVERGGKAEIKLPWLLFCLCRVAQKGSALCGFCGFVIRKLQLQTHVVQIPIEL